MAFVEQMPTDPIVDAVCCLSCGGDCRHAGAPSNAGPPRSKANDRLTLELNYQSEDVKSDRRASVVAGRAGHISLFLVRAEYLTRRHKSCSRHFVIRETRTPPGV